eukprot:9503757-Pyramimonas_sp.AAC.2
MAPFSMDDFQVSMETKGEYICGGNAAWVNPFWSYSGGMPLDVAAWDVIIKDNFHDAHTARYPGLLVVAVLGERTPANPQMRGYLRMISPEETLHALYIKVAQEIDRNATSTELKKWGAAYLSVPMKFVNLKNHWDGFWKAGEMREKIGNDYELLYPTPTQRAVQIANFKAKILKEQSLDLTHAQVFEHYKKNLTFSKASSDKMSVSYVDSALTVYKGLLSYPVALDLVTEMKNHAGKKTPYDSIYKMELYTRKANDIPRMLWMLRYTNE